MRLVTLSILAGVAIWATSAPTSSWTENPPAVVAHYDHLDPTFPEKPIDDAHADWDDTADTSDESLEIDLHSDPEVHLETDLNNDVHDPLLQDDIVQPVDILPLRDLERYPLRDPHWRDPVSNPDPWV